jgi:5-methylcytosine-specific restriction endonuclease McrA
MKYGHIMRRASYSIEQLRDAVASSKSISSVLNKLDLKLSGGAHSHIKCKIATLGIDSSHFTGQAWSRGNTNESDKRVRVNNVRSIEESYALNTHPPERPRTIRVLKDNGVPYKCSICKIDRWMGEKITLELDHINGIRSDNRIENYRLLCPNCHSQCETSTHSRSK